MWSHISLIFHVPWPWPRYVNARAPMGEHRACPHCITRFHRPPIRRVEVGSLDDLNLRQTVAAFLEVVLPAGSSPVLRGLVFLDLEEPVHHLLVPGGGQVYLVAAYDAAHDRHQPHRAWQDTPCRHHAGRTTAQHRHRGRATGAARGAAAMLSPRPPSRSRDLASCPPSAQSGIEWSTVETHLPI